MAQEEKQTETLQLEAAPTTTNYIDPMVEKRVVRKLDTHVTILVASLYLLAFLDRSNIGNAKVAGMNKDLNINDDQYTWLLTIFYIPYILFEFQSMMWKLVPPHMWAAFVVLGWGIVSAAQAATQNWGGMMALRFLMGWTEAGFGPGVPYLLSFFYLRHELGLRCGMYLSASALANTFAGALAFGITSGHAAIANWRVLFLVEGLPTVAMAVVTFFFLPDSPEKARFLNEDEKRIAKLRGVRQAGHEKRTGSLNWKEVGLALIDVKNWLTALMYFSCNVSFSSLPVFLPTILNQMGFTAINAQGLTAPPFFLSFLITIASTYLADKWQQRGLVIMALTAVGCLGYILLAATKGVGSRYAGCFLAAAGIFPAIANIMPWVMNNQGSDTRRGVGIFLLNFIGQCGPLLGTRLYPAAEAPFYVKGQSVCAAFMGFTCVLALTLRTLLVWENKKLDAQYGTLEEQRMRREQASDDPKFTNAEGVENYGPEYRFVL
ncbi:pantothenate transporter liz1 [Rhizodiscina lignyota]|uniref:Pantothenate transporter liz1 n=1 Tax=Rhizodiscina lignyota TaxID=1504668 RepID=A0A9P4ILP0_9PEZI|nr:pantothenate transporter liz1 [Rhizodiscina lignyota]